MANAAYFQKGPAFLNISGGRTSGFMLWQILEAHGGALPEDVHAVFANTGREMPATLDFVRDLSDRWGVRITWLEFVARRADGFEIVGHNSASRSGEPFARLLQAQSALPNPVARSCTAELKIRTVQRYGLSLYGREIVPAQVLGIRADEQRRVRRILDPKRQKKMGREYRNVRLPLNTGGITVADVRAFWKLQPFDLRLNGDWEGNCDGCFMKSRMAILRMFADHPERMKWWAEMEAEPRGSRGNGRFFRIDRKPYAVLANQAWVAIQARGQGALPFLDETMIEGGKACDSGCTI